MKIILIVALIVAVIGQSACSSITGTPYEKMNCSQYASHRLGLVRTLTARQLFAKGDRDGGALEPGDVVCFQGVHVIVYEGRGEFTDSVMGRGVGATVPDASNWYHGSIRVVRIKNVRQGELN